MCGEYALLLLKEKRDDKKEELKILDPERSSQRITQLKEQIVDLDYAIEKLEEVQKKSEFVKSKKIIFDSGVSNIDGTYIEEHAKRMEKVAEYLLKECNSHGLEMDFNIQIRHFASFNSYFLNMLFFLKGEPNQTTTLFTVRVFDRGDINTPVTLDMNLVDEEEVDLEKIDCVDDYEEDANLDEMTFECDGEKDFKLKANYLSKIAFEKMTKNLKEYIDYKSTHD